MRPGLVGKYHLGQPDNAQLGFDYWVTFPSGHTNNFHGSTIIDNGRTYWEGDTHLTDFWTEKAEKFIEKALNRNILSSYSSHTTDLIISPPLF